KLLDRAPSAAKFIIFDACRNELQLPTKETTKGLVPVAEQHGMFIAYASAPGRTASDRGEKSGPYAEALAAELNKPGLDHLSLFQNVKEAVYAASGGAQQPWESNGLVRRVYLTGQPAPSAQPQAPAAPTRLSEAAEAWAVTKDTTNIPALEAFIKRFGDTYYGDLAKARLAELKQAEEERKKAARKREAMLEQQRQDEARAKAEAERERTAMLEQQRQDKAREAANTEAENPLTDFFDGYFNIALRSQIGVVLATLTNELRKKNGFGNDVKGVIVLEVAGAAAEKGVKPGELIVEVGQEAVTSVADVSRGVDKVKKAGRKSVMLRLDNGKGGLRFLVVPVN